jgi:hypothetical protein
VIIDERTGKPFSSEIGTAGFAAESSVKTGKYDHPFECKRMGKTGPCMMTRAECVAAYRHALANPPKQTWQVPCLECALVRVWEKEFRELNDVDEAGFVDIEEPKKEMEMGKKLPKKAAAPAADEVGGNLVPDNHVQTRAEIVAEDLILEGLVVELPESVMERLAVVAVEEYRTPELQAAYMIHRMLDKAEQIGGAL